MKARNNPTSVQCEKVKRQFTRGQSKNNEDAGKQIQIEPRKHRHWSFEIAWETGCDCFMDARSTSFIRYYEYGKITTTVTQPQTQL